MRCGVREHATSAERTSGARSGFLDAAREALDRVGTARRRPSTKCKPAIVDLETLRVALLPHVPAQADAPDANFPLRCGVREHATSAERTSGARSCFLDAAREALDRVGAARRRPTARKQKAPLPRTHPSHPPHSRTRPFDAAHGERRDADEARACGDERRADVRVGRRRGADR